MIAYRIHGAMDLRRDEIPEPQIAPGMVKVKTEYCGLCGSDKARLIEGSVPFFPNTIGHEFCARVVEVGEGVHNVELGELVVVAPLMVCHKCYNCLTGHYGECTTKRFMGLRVADMGAFAQYNVVPQENLVKLPAGMDPKVAALTEPMSVAIHALFRSGLKPGKDIAVVGTGMIGQLIIQCARVMGARRIYAFDVIDSQLEEARRLGADKCYNSADPDCLEKFLKDTNGEGCPYVMEVVGLQSTISLSLRLCKTAGNIALVGLLGKSVTFDPVELRLISENELNLKGVWQSYDEIFPGDAWRLGVEYLNAGKIDTAKLIQRVIDPEEIIAACEDWKVPGRITGKIMVDFTKL